MKPFTYKLGSPEAMKQEPHYRDPKENEDECPHDEHDHGICLDCGKDIHDDLVGRAEYLEHR